MSLYQYQVGGSLSYQHPTYVVRKADCELYDGLKAGELCTVLNSRQMGKSSLRVQMMKRLKNEGLKCASLDMTRIGSHVTQEEWYGGVVSELLRGFSLSRKIDFSSWWQQRQFLPPVQRLTELIEDVLLVELSQNLVIFIDEIDSILNIGFKDDFFAWIRACYNQRVDNPDYHRLTFCLLGVATPSDLIQDKTRTSFNVGRAIALTGFTLEEAKLSLLAGLTETADNPQQVLAEILAWTGGQPFLTQKLCKLLVEKADSRNPDIDRFVETHIIDNWESQDEPEHLRTIRDRILRDEKRAGRLLGLYQQILNLSEGGGISTDGSSEQIELRLSGLVVKSNGCLQVYNRIYERVFNRDWIDRELAKLRPYSEALTAWLTSNREDDSRLLQGQTLQNALEWAADKSLPDVDYQFFTASQQKELKAERQANKILEAAKHQAERLLKEAKEGTKIEQAGVKAWRQFEDRMGETKALILAMEAGEALQKLVQDGRSLEEYPATSPLFALQVILDNIRERNQIGDSEQDRITSVSFSPDGQYILTGARGCVATLWDLYGNLLVEFEHNFAVKSVSFSPDGQYIATASDDDTARLWDLSGNQLAELSGHRHSATSVCFSPNGQLLAIGSGDGTVHLWDLSGNSIDQFKAHEHHITSMTFSPDGRYIATAGFDGIASLWDLSGNQLAKFTDHTHSLSSISFSPDGNYIASAGIIGEIMVWNLSGNRIERLREEDCGTCVSFSPDGKYIASGSDDGIVKFSAEDGSQLAIFRDDLGGINSISFSPDGKYLATGSDNGTTLWDLSEGQFTSWTSHQSGWLTSINFSPNGQYIATVSDDNIARIWNRCENLLVEFSLHQQGDTSIRFSPNSLYLATRSNQALVKLWNLSGNQFSEFSGSYISFSPDSEFLAIASNNITILLLDLRGNQIAEFRGRHPHFSPNGQFIALVSERDTVKVSDLSGNQIVELSGHRANFSPDGHSIVTASRSQATLWAISGHKLAEFRGHKNYVMSVNFSPDGQHIVTASDDGTARVWDLSGNEIAEFKGYPGEVMSVTFSPDNQRIATASEKSNVRLWDLYGNQIAEFKQEDGWGEMTVSFSPDGKYIVTESAYGRAGLWRVESLDELLDRGYEWLKYYLPSHPEARERLLRGRS